MAALTIERLTLDHGAMRAVDDVSVHLEAGATLCLLGPSGSGKSSILRMVAGLDRPTSGAITIDGHLVTGGDQFVEPDRRGVGMVFQDFALFPHLTVRENVGFGLRRQGRDEAAETVRGLLEDVGLSDRADRYPHMLSGGERQRVALARALAPRPRLLLMDEPFSSLDTQLREEVRTQTIALLRRRKTTTILVTHDPHEALRVADRIGVLARGRLVQLGTPSEIYRQPCSPQMACAFGAVNVIPGTLEGGRLGTPLGVFAGPSGIPSGPVTICVRPQHIALGGSSTGVPATATSVAYVGDATEVHLRVDDLELVARLPANHRVGVGDVLHVFVESTHLFVFPQNEPAASAAA